MCLSKELKNEKTHYFFKNNLINSNIWSIKVDEEKKNNNNNNNNSKTLLFDKVKSNVLDLEVAKQQQFIKDCVCKEEKENSTNWDDLKKAIKNRNIAEHGEIRQCQVIPVSSILGSQKKFSDLGAVRQLEIKTRNFVLKHNKDLYHKYKKSKLVNTQRTKNTVAKRIDLMSENGISVDYDKNELPLDNGDGFDGQKEYSYNGYLSKLLITAYQVNPIFESKCREILSQSKLGVKCEYKAAPVKLKERCKLKAELDYSNREYPSTSYLLDIIRCSLVLETTKDLIQAIVTFTHLIESGNGGCITHIVRIKNGFADIDDSASDCALSQFRYSDVKVYVYVYMCVSFFCFNICDLLINL